ncbi:MAG: D-2-hydroxyacid dehydrogenase [Caulobacteraceae bacterium]
MARLILFEPTYRRLQAEIDAAAAGIELLLMGADGVISLNGAPVSVDEAQPNAAWFSQDLFASAAARDVWISCLKAENLKWAQSSAAGFDHPVFGDLVRKGATLTTSHGQAVGMAEYVIAGVLDHFQRAGERRAAQAAGTWTRVPFREVNGTTWLIIGYGAIGQGAAKTAKALGATVIGVRRDQSAHESADRIVPLGQVMAELPGADVVVLSVPLTAETKHLVNASFVAAMKPGSVLVNVGRGGLVDEPALLAGLDAGKPEHAVLDVFETEPLPAASPFWAHPRVALTPHAAGISNGSGARNETLFVENLRRFAAGEPLLNAARPEDVLAGREA